MTKEEAPKAELRRHPCNCEMDYAALTEDAAAVVNKFAPATDEFLES
jgi:hypothetical protein